MPTVAAMAVGGAALAAAPAALAHGASDPAASSFLARIGHAPAGLEAKVVDGDLRLWLQVSSRDRVTVLDYRGAPYVRFTPHGVQVNANSEMYYLNLVPPATPPLNLGPSVRPQWLSVSGGRSYEWHDGRLQDLSAVAIAPGTRYVGRWSIPVLVDGRRLAITGSLWYAPDPPLLWFWPIAVVLACLVAGLRLRRPALDQALMRALAFLSLIGFVVLATGRGLHGRPGLSAFALVGLGLELAFAACALGWLVRARRHNWLGLMLIGGAAAWGCATTFGVLLHGYVLLAVPAPLARAATSMCLAAGPALVLLSVRTAFASTESDEAESSDELDEMAPAQGLQSAVGDASATGT